MALLRYLAQYRFKDMGEVIRNGKGEPADCAVGMKGKTVVLSGATSGIGRETALLLAKKGARLVCLNRDPEKSLDLERVCRERFRSPIRTILVDFRSLDQVKQCAADLLNLDHPIDVIIHNTGVFNTRNLRTEDGIEMVFQVNHLGSFVINHMLKERMRAENRARIIYVNSEGHRFALAGVHLKDLHWKRHIYTGLRSYGAAKTAQLLTMRRFYEYFSDTSVTVNAMHPGNVLSNMGENNGRLYRLMKKKLILSTAKDPALSAKALHFLAAAEEMNGVSGEFFHWTTLEKVAPHARDPGAVEPVWNKSLELCGFA